jgi:uncharacterized protein (TIGR04255 family)
MVTPRHLRNAPIAESIIDFRVKARTGFRPEEFSNLKTKLANQFPNVQERRLQQTSVEVIKGKAQPPVVKDLGFQGYFFKTSDEKTIAQFRIDGFAFNRLRPYTSWEEIFPQAMELWRLYANVCKPEVIIRVAVRYINQIVMKGGADLETYLRTAPIIPQELPQHVRGFLTRITIYDPDKDIAANVIQALQESKPGSELAVILDIDAYKEGEFSADDPNINQTFEQLRAFKNLIFFNHLTENTLRGFE